MKTGSDEADGGQQQAEVIELGPERVRRFLKELADKPFIAVTFHDDAATFYTKGVDGDRVARIIQTLSDNEE